MSKKLRTNNRKKSKECKLDVRVNLVSTHAITLISLIVTIVILIILAGVVLTLTIGENGIFRIAREARDKYLTETEKEQQKLNELYAQLNRGNEPENTPETEAGTRVKLPSEWVTITPNYVNTEDGNIVKKMEVSSTTYAISGGNGVTVPVPEGFYYVGGDINTGIVISDAKADGYETTKEDMTSHDDSVKLVGNQFVWIPCKASEYRKVTWAKWNAQWDKETGAREYNQIKKYGGFWIGRYEAGVATLNNTEGEETSFTDSVTFTDNKRLSNAVQTQTTINMWTHQNYDFTARQEGSTVGTGTNKAVGNVISKANSIPYYHSDYYTAIEMSRRMYENNKYVKSELVTGTEWDMMCKYMQSKGINVEGTVEAESQWGNYTNISLTGLRGAYAKVNSSGATESFKKVPEIEGTTSANLKSNYVLLTTGSTEQVKKMNLYDVSGNVMEWTNEVSYRTDTKGYHTNILRGGNAEHNSTNNPVSHRYGIGATSTDTFYGFRVALCLD